MRPVTHLFDQVPIAHLIAQDFYHAVLGQTLKFCSFLKVHFIKLSLGPSNNLLYPPLLVQVVLSS